MHDDKTQKRGKRRQAEDAPKDEGERIAKRLSRAGVASRREAEALIADGRVRVNGHVLETPAVTVTDADRIEIDGQPIPAVERTRLFLFHKPAGVVTTNRDPEGRRTIFDVLPDDLPRLMTVGRLDINTEGLLLLTNDGGLARVLELPQTGWMRRYRVRVHGTVDEKALAGLKDGIAVDGVFYGAVEASLERVQGSNAWLLVGLREGKNREVKNIMAALGLEVTRLIRVSFGPFQLAELPEGDVHEIKGRTLRDQLGPRLIEDAGANFDAPLAPRSAAEPEPQRAARGERTERPARPAMREEAGGLIRNRKRGREEARDSALARLSTSAPPRGKARARDDERAAEPRRPRGANVWMAPGARPVSRDEGQAEGEEKVTRVARKPGDRKAKHDAAAKRARPGRRERAAGAEATDRPKREWKPRPEGAERPQREWTPRPPREGAEASDRPKRAWKPRPEGAGRPERDWKAKPPRPGRAERAEAKTSGEAPAREYRPRPKREAEGGEARPRREWTPRPPRDGEAAADRPKREWKPRPEGAERPKRDFKPRGDGDERPRREWKPSAEGAAGRPTPSRGKPFGGRPSGGKPGGKPFGGKPGAGPRKGPPRGGKKG